MHSAESPIPHWLNDISLILSLMDNIEPVAIRQCI